MLKLFSYAAVIQQLYKEDLIGHYTHLLSVL